MAKSLNWQFHLLPHDRKWCFQAHYLLDGLEESKATEVNHQNRNSQRRALGKLVVRFFSILIFWHLMHLCQILRHKGLIISLELIGDQEGGNATCVQNVLHVNFPGNLGYVISASKLFFLTICHYFQHLQLPMCGF